MRQYVEAVDGQATGMPSDPLGKIENTKIEFYLKQS
jgi:hypothetical protein